jgi:hypothetical protein
MSSNQTKNHAIRITHDASQTKVIPLGHGKYAVIDAEDYERISKSEYRPAATSAARRESKTNTKC